MFTPSPLNLPSYAEATHTKSGKQSLHENFQLQIRQELQSLSYRLVAAQSSQQSALQTCDSLVLEVLIPYISAFLEDYINSSLSTATLTLVPAAAIPEGSIDALDDLREEDDFAQVVRVNNPTGVKGQTRNVEWNGEAMTRRLAQCLLPAPISSERAFTPPARATSKSKSKSKLSWRKPGKEAKGPNVDDKKLQLPTVGMNVRPENVVFRVETPYGSYESASVWGLVVKLHLNGDKMDKF